MKNVPRDVIILNKCTKNYDHMAYFSWDIARDRCNYFLFWAIFCPFTPLTCLKNENFKKMKKHLEISSFYKNEPKIMIVCYTVAEIRHVTNVIIIFHFGLFFALLPFCPSTLTLTAQKIQISKKSRNCLVISSFYTCVPKIMIRW